MSTPSRQHVYDAVCVRVIDGDTFVARVDLGFHVSTNVTVRIRGVNSPERTGEERVRGEDARKWLQAQLFHVDETDRVATPLPLMLQSYKDRQSFARWVADVWLVHDRLRTLAEAIIESGHGTRA